MYNIIRINVKKERRKKYSFELLVIGLLSCSYRLEKWKISIGGELKCLAKFSNFDESIRVCKY